MTKTNLRVLLAILLAISTSTIQAQLSGTKNIPGDYADLAAAITDLNTQGVGAGGVILNILPGNAQTAPAGGYVIGGAGSAVLTTSSAANPISIIGNGNVLTASASHVAGVLTDAIIKIIGADYVTLNGLLLFENAANIVTTAASNTMTEWGIALLYATTTDGAQNITISNDTIDLNRTYVNTFGIYSNSTHSSTTVGTSATATTTAGSNSGLTIVSSLITDVNLGIVVVGPTAAADYNDGVNIGGNTAITGNVIANFGTNGTFSTYVNVSGTVNGILVRNTKNYNISYNTVSSSNGGVTAGTLNGIQVPANTVTPTGTFTNNINFNSISLTSAAAAGVINGINVGGTSASVTSGININNNNFSNFGHTVAGTAAITFITQGGPHLNQSISNNTFSNISVNTTGSVTFISNSQSLPAAGIKNVNNNSIVTGFTKTGPGGTVTFFTDNGSDPIDATNNLNNNIFSNIVVSGATTVNGFSNTNGGSPIKNIINNTVSNITGGTSAIQGFNINFDAGTTTMTSNTVSNITAAGAITGINFGTSGTNGTTNASQNTIHTLSGSGTGAVTGIIIGGTTGQTRNIFRTKIYNLENTNAGGSVTGINAASSANINIYNNLIGDLRAPNLNAANSLIGINVSGGTNVSLSFNTVYLNATSVGALFGSSAVSASTTPVLAMNNNIFVNTSTSAGATGYTVAYRRSSTTLTSYAAGSNNNLYYAGTPSATNLIFYQGTTAADQDQTLAAFKTRVSPRDLNSVTENPNFLSVAGANANFLHINTAIATQIESGGATVAGIANDFDGDARNGSTPDIGADEFVGIALDMSGPTITHVTVQNTCTAGSRIITATITDASGVPTAGAGLPVAYWNINGGAYIAATGSFAGGNLYQFTIGTGSVSGDVINYYFAAQDNAGTPNISVSPAAGAAGFSSNPPAASTAPSSAYSYLNLGVMSGIKTVGTGGDYATLTAAVAAYNSNCLTGAVVFNLIDANYSASETFPLTINFNPSASSVNTLTIQPATGVAVSVISSNSTALFDLNGAKYVTIKGLNAGGSSLLLRNTSTGGAVVRFINDATNNTLDSLTIESGNTSASSGSIFFSTSTGTTGNSNNNIQNSVIRSDASGVHANTVYSNGSTTALNADNTISGNEILNFTGNAVLVTNSGNGNTWNINQNKFYQTAARTTAINVISIQSGSGHTISGNSIGGAAADRSGVAFTTTGVFNAISLTVGTATPTSVQGNIISNLNVSGGTNQTWGGIFIAGGNVNVGTVTGNRIGTALAVHDTIRVSYDARAIYNTGAGTLNIENNIIGNLAYYRASGDELKGIKSTGGINIIRNNIVRDLKSNASANSTFFLTGIDLQAATAGNVVEKNQVNNLLQTNPAGGSIFNMGMFMGGMTSGEIRKNVIHSIDGQQASLLYGIYKVSGSATYSNNMVSLNPTGIDHFVAGIRDDGAAGTNNWFYNTVYLGGAATTVAPSYAFYRSNAAVADIRNNIFSNFRSGGTGVHVALANVHTTGTGWSSNYNDLFNLNNAHLAQWLGTAPGNSFDLAGFRTASGGDLNSINVQPFFVSPTNLHIDPLQPANASLDNLGTPLAGITTDIDEQARTATPDMGADEFTTGVIPVTIEYFRGSKQSTGNRLDWKVSCYNSPSTTMTLERSADGRRFTAINVQTETATRCLQPFDHLDAAPLQGINYYRLKSVDANGKVSYSNIVALLNQVKGFELISMVPNPVINTAIFKVSSAVDSKMTLLISDATGRKLSTQSVQILAGENQLQFNFSSLAAGTYQVTGFSPDGQVRTLRFVKQ